VLEIDRLPGEAGAAVTFSEVLLAGSKIVRRCFRAPRSQPKSWAQDRAPKVVAFKKKRRKNTHASAVIVSFDGA